MGKHSVKRLEDIAFWACYQDILSNLILCCEHRPESERHPITRSSLISSNPLFTSKNVLYNVRENLNQHLVGTLNDDIRAKIIREFAKESYDYDNKPDLWALFECVIDENFKELSIPVAFPRTEPNPLTINTIAKRAPELSTLKLNFYFAARKFSNPEALRNFCQSLSAPKNLTSLTLCQLSKRHRALFQYLGNACPKLKYLSLTGLRFNRNDLVSLILGEVVQLLPDTKKDFLFEDNEDIHSLEIPQQFLSAFCATLEHLQLEPEEAEKKKLQASFEYTGLCHFAVAFAFRHLPKLQQFNHSGSSTSSAVKLLYHLGINNSENQMEHENIYQENSQSLLLSWTIKTPFSGTLSLVSLDFVNIRSVEMIKAVGKMCPALKEILFCELMHANAADVQELSDILKTQWPKIERITFCKVTAIYCQTVLEAFESELKELTLASCENIDILSIMHCTRLEKVRFLLASKLLKLEDTAHEIFSSGTFLPNLKHFESDICLGIASPVFEQKVSLAHLSLDCTHISTKVGDSDWNGITKYWRKNLKTLCIKRSSNLSMSMVSRIVPQLPKLKELSLSSWMLNSKEERHLSYELTEKFWNESKIRLKFDRSLSNTECPYQNPTKPEYETSSDGDNSSDESGESDLLAARNEHLGIHIDHDWDDHGDEFENYDFDSDHFDEDGDDWNNQEDEDWDENDEW